MSAPKNNTAVGKANSSENKNNTPSEDFGLAQFSNLMKKIFKIDLVVLLSYFVVGCAACCLFYNPSELLSIVIAFLILCFFFLTNPIVFYLIRKLKVKAWAGVLMASWMLKTILVVVVMLVLRSNDFLNYRLLGLFILLGAALILSIETSLVYKARLPYTKR